MIAKDFSTALPVAPETVATWQAQLEAAIPPSEHTVSHLRLVWEPGEPWAPVGRWFLYDCVPRSVFERSAQQKRMAGCPEYDNGDAVLIADLDGLNPRECGTYDPILREFLTTSDRNCTERQWKLWHEHRVWGTPFWVIQGTHGGHKWAYNTAERKVLRYAGLPDLPPGPGALPYAPFDNRVLDKVLAYDRLRSTEGLLGRDAVARADRNKVQAARKAYVDFLTDSVGDLVREFKHALQELPRDFTQSTRPTVDYDEEVERFITKE